MRADAHYVEHLDSRSNDSTVRLLAVATIEQGPRRAEKEIPALVESIVRRGILQPLLVARRSGRIALVDGHRRLRAAIAAGLDEVPCVVHDVGDGELAALAEDANVLRSPSATVAPASAPSSVESHVPLAQALRAVDTATHLLAAPASDLTRRVAVDLIRAEVWRAMSLLEAAEILRHDPSQGQSSCSARRLVTMVVDRAESERRLRGCTLHTECDIPESLLVAGAPAALQTALAGMLLASFAAAEGRPGAQIALAASLDATRQIAFTVSTVGMTWPPEGESRAFDPTWTDRPGGVAACVWLLAARTIAEAHGGRVEVSVTPRGIVLKMVMPVPAA